MIPAVVLFLVFCVTSSQAFGYDKELADNRVVVFSKSYCPYCKGAKALLTELGIPFFALELDQEANGGQIQKELKELTKQSTVPNIWINGVFIGGKDDLFALHAKGELVKLTQKIRNKDL